jgi:rubrerythrin
MSQGWEIFLKAMEIEEKGAMAKYKLAAELAESKELQELFEKLAEEEAFHAQYLQGEYERLMKAKGE